MYVIAGKKWQQTTSRYRQKVTNRKSVKDGKTISKTTANPLRCTFLPAKAAKTTSWYILFPREVACENSSCKMNFTFLSFNMKNGKIISVQNFLLILILIVSISQVSLLLLLDVNNTEKNEISINKNYKWPPIKVFVYENNSRHTSDCLYPPEMPMRYVNESGFWFQRMLEPTVHRQFSQKTKMKQTSSSFHITRGCAAVSTMASDGTKYQSGSTKRSILRDIVMSII